jgi:hypothetical protein
LILRRAFSGQQSEFKNEELTAKDAKVAKSVGIGNDARIETVLASDGPHRTVEMPSFPLRPLRALRLDLHWLNADSRATSES